MVLLIRLRARSATCHGAAALFACPVVTYPVLETPAFLLPSGARFLATRSFGGSLLMLASSWRVVPQPAATPSASRRTW